MRNLKFKIVAIAVLGVIALAFSAGTLATTSSSHGKAVVKIPPRAKEITPGVFQLGSVIHHGQVVEGYAFIHPYRGLGKPSGCNNDGKCQGWESSDCADCAGGGGEGDDAGCYGFLAKGAKWKTVEDYIVNPANDEDLAASFITSNLAADITKWESAAGVGILGNEVSGLIDGADLVAPDDQNEVYFGNIDYPGAIAITVVWGVFGGPPWGRELVEWDQVYDEVDFDWSANGEAGKMDFENIATHELGHSVGLDDLYEDRCAEQTMYGFASNGETKKRTLKAGDITGVKRLYQ